MRDITIQKADRESLETLSRFCLHIFSKGFSLEGQEKGILSLLMTGLNPDALYMAVSEGMLRGVFAISDGRRRAVTGTAAQFRKELGFVLGTVAYPVIRKEMMDEVALRGQKTVIEWLLAADEGTLATMADYIRRHFPGPYLLFSFDPATDPFLINNGFIKTSAHAIAPGMEKRVFEG